MSVRLSWGSFGNKLRSKLSIVGGIAKLRDTERNTWRLTVSINLAVPASRYSNGCAYPLAKLWTSLLISFIFSSSQILRASWNWPNKELK